MKTLLIANRGEIACRIIRTAKLMNIRTVAVFSDIDRHALHVQAADTAVALGGETAAESYLLAERILEAAKQTGADAIHPGYGFLSENAGFARAAESAGITFVGPPASAIDAMGSKSAAKVIMANAGVPLLPGYHGDDQSSETLLAAAEETGFPVLLKAAAGGGGKGMRIVHDAASFDDELAAAKREAAKSFGDDKMLVEKYLVRPRHVELQIFADTHGNVVHLFDRDCSVQRRHQKIIEEAPAPDIEPDVRQAMADAAIAAAKAIDYVGAGTVEFLLDTDGSFYFMEMNTRLQVEHPVSEMISGQDFVAWQIAIARGEPLPMMQDALSINGHSIESRIYAENPDNEFLPDSGLLERLRFPATGHHTRVDTGVAQGDTISIHYDPMIAKVVSHGSTRDDAIRTMQSALTDTRVIGPETNIDYLLRVLAHPDFQKTAPSTGFVNGNAPDLGPTARQPDALIAAAIVVSQPASDASLWLGFPGWRANLPQTVEVPLTDHHGDIRVTLEYVNHTLSAAVIDDTRYDVEADVDCETVATTINGSRQQHRWLMADDRVLISNDRHYHFQKTPVDIGDGAGMQDDTHLKAPMSGKVVALRKQQGDTVSKGDAIVIVEAMKMEHTLRATNDGQVEACFVSEGDLVHGEQLLVTLTFENGD